MSKQISITIEDEMWQRAASSFRRFIDDVRRFVAVTEEPVAEKSATIELDKLPNDARHCLEKYNACDGVIRAKGTYQIVSTKNAPQNIRDIILERGKTFSKLKQQWAAVDDYLNECELDLLSFKNIMPEMTDIIAEHVDAVQNMARALNEHMAALLCGNRLLAAVMDYNKERPDTPITLQPTEKIVAADCDVYNLFAFASRSDECCASVATCEHPTKEPAETLSETHAD